jgi:hypothetical protein
MAKGGTARKTAEPEMAALPLEEQVRRRAHEIWLQRGGENGLELDDWQQAEEEIQLAQERK